MDAVSGHTLTFGLRDTDWTYMIALFTQHPAIEQVWLYGSRAKGTNRPGADVDLAVVGPNVTAETIRHLHFVLEEEGPMPFFFDVLHWDTLSNQPLKAEIQRTAQPVYQRPA